MKLVTDPHDVQEIRNSIAEGVELLRYGKDTNGKPLPAGRRIAIKRSISNAQSKITD